LPDHPKTSSFCDCLVPPPLSLGMLLKWTQQPMPADKNLKTTPRELRRLRSTWIRFCWSLIS